MGKGNGGERPATDGGAPLNASFQGPEAITFSRAPRVLKRTAAAPLREALAFTHWPLPTSSDLRRPLAVSKREERLGSGEPESRDRERD